jgi:uncharacterized protein (TIGR03435 family)
MKESVEDAAPKGGGPADDPSPAPGKPALDRDGFPVLPPAAAGRTAVSLALMNGNVRMTASKQPMSGLAEDLSRQLDLPVVDMTGLTGKYDFTLYFSPEGLAGMRLPAGLAPPPGEGGGEMPAASTPDGQSSPSLFAALQEQLGLRLEQRKGPVELLVIDHLERAPIEN